MHFSNKIILITGASSGIGAATAKYFAKFDAKLALTGRNLDKLNQVSNDCFNLSPSKYNPFIIQADLNKEEDTKKIINSTIDHYKQLNVLINNAGIIELGTIENTSLDQYDRLMNTNVRSIYHLTMLSVPYLIQTKGNIVNVSSVNGLRSFPGVLAYCMSKSALDQFTSCTALELASKGVRVNSVNPGVIITNLQRTGGLDEEKYEAFLERSKETHALGRVGNPEEVAKAIAFLASDEASFTTGEHLTVDGGRHAMCPR